MRFCTDCGKDVSESSKFCGDCGAKLASLSSTRPKASAYSRTSLKIDPIVSADYFVARVEEMLTKEVNRVQDLKELYGEDWQSVFTDAVYKFPILSPKADILSMLKSEAGALKTLNIESVIDVHNYAVLALRHMCNEETKDSEKVTVREGLIIPRDWQVHYENLLDQQSPLLILAVMQHVFTGNPLGGELYEWTNQKGGLFGGNNKHVKRTIIGASVIGAAAALLLGG